MSKCVLLYEDDRVLSDLVRDLLEEQQYQVVHVSTLQELLIEATRRCPCVALLDSTNSSHFDLWWLGPVLAKLGVPPVAFTAHGAAHRQFVENANDFHGVVSKPFNVDEFIALVDSVCWEGQERVAS